MASASETNLDYAGFHLVALPGRMRLWVCCTGELFMRYCEYRSPLNLQAMLGRVGSSKADG